MRTLNIFFFFFSSRRRHTRLQGDWSSDVCSSDLRRVTQPTIRPASLSVELLRQLCDLTTEIMLPAGKRSTGNGRHGARPRQELEHLPRAQPLAHVERRLRSPPRAFDEREVEVHVPLVRAKGGAAFLQRHASGDSLDLRDGGLQLRNRITDSATTSQGTGQAR